MRYLKVVDNSKMKTVNENRRNKDKTRN